MGNECIRQEISAEVAGIAEATGAMVTSANKVPVVFPTTHPNYGGRYGDDKQLSKDVDTFWSIGGHMFKYASKPDGPMVPRDATTIHTSYSELDMARNYPVDLGAIASIKSTTGLVLEELKRRNTNTSAIKARQQWIGEYNAKRRKTLNEIAAKESENSPLSTSLLIIELDKVAESDADIVSEVVTSENHIRHYLNFDHTLPFEARRKNYDTTSGVLGWGIAAAIGVKIGRPNTENWCLTGDGCFNFGSQALWSASRYDANIGIIVFNN
ncbi:MAG: thiamine pyrophosphate-binding protein, partial [Proteobacteria bacterium]|nr:thiamine pyrophosphate-binding protein [Pseudomonadota bacterium]